ncbi:MAG: hypothetical protein LC102_10375 [Ignavibacteriales bacterium]|nr:MAG: hypothetical protein F9K26_12055 [Ignavibacteriaceae bacterium]MBW7873590.1 hypothetical protein [Ignavibacteria bacterium]MCZ2143820.1 hypothetical protein [Ignavibacteriales bacterium]OQY71219.1 MAG: hypothetical protein B6D45_10360 [Ignavibacteriales bacterium UTCHB3]MBV6445909.1 hypothetical protein [Ignavibacteriaceae bacterium]
MKTIAYSLFVALFLATALFPQKSFNVKTAVMISEGDGVSKLKSNDLQKASNQFRILLNSEAAGFVYFLMESKGKVKLLSSGKATAKVTSTYPKFEGYSALPPKGEHKFIIFFSTKKLSSLEELFKKSSEVSAKNFSSVLNNYKKTQTSISDKSPEDIYLAGNTKGLQEMLDNNFLQKLKPFAVKSLLILEYKFRTK